MKTTNHIRIQLFKMTIILAVILATVLQSAKAQGFKQFARKNQVGFEGSFGIKTFTMSSDIAQIDGLVVVEDGGNIGVGIGAGAFRLKVRQGYYYSSSSVAQTVDEVRSSVAANIYPMQLFGKSKSRFQPYVTGTVEHNILNMYGTYGGETSQIRNYSVSQAPFLGRINTVVASVGAGIEYKVTSPGHFISFFAEGRCGKAIQTLNTSNMFSSTATSNQVAVNIGIAFGYGK